MFIAIGHQAWGKADSIAEAVKNARGNLGSTKLRANVPAFTLFLCDEGTRVDEFGGFVWPAAAKRPQELGNFDWNGKALLSD